MADFTLSRAAVHQLIDELPEEHLPAAWAALTQLQQDALRSALASTPGLGMPAHWPPRFGTFEPIEVEGEPVSEQLIRERR